MFDDPIEAWKYGPVVTSIYYALRNCEKNTVITEKIKGHIIENK
ncbi:MAG: hypothetical protein LBO66_01655 [Deltaproteobacteria bacterium]|nr:hypothetical protein [Deltaproteobacteria bacterium]